MKTLFLKNGMPIATAVLAIIGAFATTSMQSSSKSFALRIGYTQNAQGECDIAVVCCDVPNTQICRAWYPGGPIAYGRNPVTGQCGVVILYRPLNP